MTTKIKVNSKSLYESLEERYAATANVSDWAAFLNSHKIEVIKAKLDVATMKDSSGNQFCVCADPAYQNDSLKIPSDLACKIEGDPYFDVELDDYSKVDAIIQTFDQSTQQMIEEMREWGGGGTKYVTVMLPVRLDCNWDGDAWHPDVDVADVGDSLKYGVDWDDLDFKATTKKDVMKEIKAYLKIVLSIASTLKVSSHDVHKAIMGWS